MGNINIAKLLKDCPKGMELDCVSYDNVSFDKVSNDKKAAYPIFCYITDKEGNRSSISFTENGCESKRYGAKCVIFPKGKTTWEGFQRPFISGDILINKNESIFIYKGPVYYNKMLADFYCVYRTSDGAFISKNFNDRHCGHLLECRFATEKEKQKLFQVIKDNGYKWNIENKILEKLPKFKVGDRVKHISAYTSGIVVKVSDKGYLINYPKGEGVCYISFELEKNYELSPNKFDITTLKPFESWVLVRNSDSGFWKPAFWGIYEAEKTNEHQYRNYLTTEGFVRYCIPYNDETKHLLGTTNDCDDFYKTWEE